ncbi:hypothetical protein H206_05433 [Candidatus Electrothrix aarhusensis]|uniref:Uncharacterized protein n=1 Tax=Candidatus Electrothrix aarhusensis TaxID=1859131 RepID=A0A3S3SQU7_9BACT|nr:hypothetical protein H206_05433 [Candidatus Electrothrix aarhusensis]
MCMCIDYNSLGEVIIKGLELEATKRTILPTNLR